MYIVNSYILSPPFDADAQAFITAASITDPTQQLAVNQLVLDLKAASIWTKGSVIKPFVGGTASSHLYNLKTASQIGSFAGGITHNSNGVTFNGTTGYHNSGFQTTVSNIYDRSAFWYIRDVTTGSGSGWMGNFNGGIFGIQAIKDAGAYKIWADGLNRLYSHSGSVGFNKGLVGASITSITSGKMYDNTGVRVTNNAIANTPQDNQTMYSGALNSGGSALLFGNQNIAFEFYGVGLNDAEATSLNIAVQAFQTTLSRQV